MSRKGILNLVAVKKKDTLLPSTAVPATEAGIGSLPIGVGDDYTLLWEPTARERYTPTEDFPTAPANARSASTCFFVGVKEKIQVNTTNGQNWTWRRVIFTAKGPIIDGNYRDYTERSVDLSNGTTYYQRANSPLPTQMASDLHRLVFRGLGTNADGQIPRDWLNRFTAPVDTRRINLLYDKTVRISSGNGEGVEKYFTRWHPVRKNMVYDEREEGGEELNSSHSTRSKPGMGDLYIMDIIDGNGVGDTTTGSIYFNPQTTVYWHER